CMASESMTLTEPTTGNVSAALSDAGNGYEIGCSGNDGAIDITASGGLAPYSYDWSGSGGFASLNEDLTSLNAGTYNVTVIDANGCTTGAQYVLDQAAPLDAGLAMTGNVCDGLDD